MEEQEIKEQVKDLENTLAGITSNEDKPIEIVGIQLMLFEMAVHLVNQNINKYVEEKMKKTETENKENKESEEK